MSVVTNIILTFSSCENTSFIEKQLGDYKHRDHPFILTSINEWGKYAGSKNLEGQIYIGAYNHIDIKGLIAHLISIEWDSPDLVRLFIKEEDDFAFKSIRLGTEDESEEPLVVDKADLKSIEY